jgi:hypothetical protein
MFDIQTTIKWVQAALSSPDTVARSYQETGPGWQRSFVQLTLPLYVAAYLVAAILAMLSGGSLPLGSLSLGVFLFSMLWGMGWTFVIAFIFDYLSGTFDGKRDFDGAYAVVALAIVPSALGSAVGPLPWIGWLLSLAGGIYAMVLAYRFLPVFLEIPDAARTKHFVLSIIAAIVVNIVVSLFLATLFAPSVFTNDYQQPASEGSGATVGGGLFGGLERQADFVEAASADTYEPPADGRLSQEQVRAFARILEKTRALEDRLGKDLEKMEDSQPSLSDVFSGVGDAMRLSTAEMEVVKTGGGNWAEHQWVRSQLETARIQQDLNDQTQHNYRLFEMYREEIERYE